MDLKSKVAVIDYETYWDAEYSVTTMSYWHYCHDPRFDAYLVSIVTSDGFEWVGHPSEAPWDRVKDYVWVSHNRPFDESVHKALQESGVVPSWMPVYWGDTIALCAWIRVPRALAKAVAVLYKKKLSKQIRDKDVKGVRWAQFSEDLKKRICEYALEDGRWPLRIWLEHVDSWPEKERRIADLIANRGLRGLAVDKPAMESDMEVMRRVIFEATQRIPWASDPDEKILSKPACDKECRKQNIPPPPSLAMTDEGLQAWEDEYSDRFPFVAAMRDWRRMNGMLKKYETIYSRIKPDGRFEFSLSYLGTHTGRTSGTDRGSEQKRQSANILNFPRTPFYITRDWTVLHKKEDLKRVAAYRKKHKALPEDVAYAIDLRSKIVPGPGKKFVICDASQIEPRIANWIVLDRETLDLLRKGFNPYDAHAIKTMGYVPEVVNGKPRSLSETDEAKYSLAKAREISLNYQVGHVKFIVMAATYVSEEDFLLIFDRPYAPEQESAYLQYLEATRQTALAGEYRRGDEAKKRFRIQSWIQVDDFRRKKPQLVRKWKVLDDELRRSAASGGTHVVKLPSGRELRYFNAEITPQGIQVSTERGGDRKYMFGGKIFENCCQAIARDIFIENQLVMADEDIYVAFDVYDEVVCEVDQDFNGSRVREIMSTPPSWARTLPLAAKHEETLCYKK